MISTLSIIDSQSSAIFSALETVSGFLMSSALFLVSFGKSKSAWRTANNVLSCFRMFSDTISLKKIVSLNLYIYYDKPIYLLMRNKVIALTLEPLRKLDFVRDPPQQKRANSLKPVGKCVVIIGCNLLVALLQ